MKSTSIAAWASPHEEVADYLRQAGLEPLSQRDLAPGGAAAEDKLTVSLWLARDPRPAHQ